MTEDLRTKSPLLARLLIGGVDRLPWPADLLLLGARLYAGYTIASAGLDKLPVPSWMVEQVAQMGFPAVELFALAACLTEFAGGVLLIFGLLTRPAAALLAFTMGAASFRFHGLTPITGMHIAQGFFWLFVVFVALGGGRLSVDHVVRKMLSPRGSSPSPGAPRVALAAAVLAAIPTAYGLHVQYAPPPEPEASQPVAITAMSVAGSFNDWDLTTHPLERQDHGGWSGTIEFAEAGPITFKFAANGSWDVNLGDDDPGTAGFPLSGTGDPGGENIAAYIPQAGAYRFTVDSKTSSYRVEKTGMPAPPD